MTVDKILRTSCHRIMSKSHNSIFRYVTTQMSNIAHLNFEGNPRFPPPHIYGRINEVIVLCISGCGLKQITPWCFEGWSQNKSILGIYVGYYDSMSSFLKNMIYSIHKKSESVSLSLIT